MRHTHRGVTHRPQSATVAPRASTFSTPDALAPASGRWRARVEVIRRSSILITSCATGPRLEWCPRNRDRHLLGAKGWARHSNAGRSEEQTSELQSHSDLVCRLLLEKK